MAIINIENITLEDAYKWNLKGIGFIIRDGKLKGFTKR